MKKTIKLSLILIIAQIFAFSTIAMSDNIEASVLDQSDDAIEYNDQMIQIQSLVDADLVILLDAIDTGKDYNIKGALKECKKTIKTAKKSVKKIGTFNDDDQYQTEMLSLIAMYEDILKNEVAGIIEVTLSAEELSEDQYTEIFELYDGALVKYETSFEKFQDYQYKFADKWDFSIDE